MVVIQIASPPGTLCDQVEQRIKELAGEQGLDCSIELVTDFEAIISLQVYSIPGLIVDGVLKSVGRVPEMVELIDWLGLDIAENSKILRY